MNFGSIYVEFAEPISFKSYVQEMVSKQNLSPAVNKEDRMLITSSLGYHLIHKLSENLVIMPTSICASILLMHRKGISEDELIKQVGYLIQILKQRNVIIPAYCNSAKICVRKGTSHLDETVSKKKDIFEPRVIPKIDYKNILLLSYYRNNMIHLFINEAFVACSLFGFGHQQSWQTGVHKKDLWEKVLFISTLLRNEFVLATNFNSVEDYNAVLDGLFKSNTLQQKEDGLIVIHPEGENHINYLNSLIWPFIDTYWVTFVFIFSLVPSKFVQESKIYEKIQWFAESLYEDQIINFYESCSQEIIKNAVNTFYTDGIIVKKKLETVSDGVKDPLVYTLEDAFNDEDRMQQFFEKLSHFKKSTLIKMNNVTSIRKTLLSDFPFMAKM
jgi:glycerone phosphate O-acyltransferase/fatty acyl-CoA reductase